VSEGVSFFFFFFFFFFLLLLLLLLLIGYISATTGRGDHEVHKGHVVALVKEKMFDTPWSCCGVVVKALRY
jgi:hypothetical protein